MSTVLLFKNLISENKKNNNFNYTLATFNLMSALKHSGHTVVISDYCFHDDRADKEKKKLKNFLLENPCVNIIGISLMEAYFLKIRELISFLHGHTKAFIGVGGIMPTLTPVHVIHHMPYINFLARGDAEALFPEFAKIVNGKNRFSPLDRDARHNLKRLNGFYFKNHFFESASSLNTVNTFSNQQAFPFDYDSLDSEELKDGIFVFTSRGCLNHCFFCSTPGNGKFLSRDINTIFYHLGEYSKKINEIFLHGFSEAEKVSFYDDDFLADPNRAKKIFSFFEKSILKINFFQTGIRSFFKKSESSQRLNHNLIRSIQPKLFSKHDEHIFIGTENFSDSELNRLGKNYTFLMVEKTVKELCKNKICQRHHFILSNQLTGLNDVFLNLYRIAILQFKYGSYFKILTPIIPYLVSFFPTKSYEAIRKNKRTYFLKISSILKNKNAQEYDYPLIEHDVPLNPLVRIIVPEIEELFNRSENYLKIFEVALYKLLILYLTIDKKDKSIELLINKYHKAYKSISKKKNANEKVCRANIQLMMTRRCHLRCAYCPVEKKDSDLSESLLIKSIDVLCDSSSKHLRLDFTGGEPLLRFDMVKKAVSYAKNQAMKQNKTVSFYMVSNLLALDEKMADYLAQENFFLELSIDGDEKTHNLFKICADNALNPYRQTISKLKMLFERKIDCHAVMVACPESAGTLKNNFSHLLELGLRKIGINYSLCAFWPQAHIEIFLNQLQSIKDGYHDLIFQNDISLTNLNSRMEPAILNSEIMVDTDGKVYFLSDWLFEKQTRKKIKALGHINDFYNFNDIIFSNFLVLRRLIDNYPYEEIKNIILNNIYFGNLVDKFFKTWKKELNH